MGTVDIIIRAIDQTSNVFKSTEGGLQRMSRVAQITGAAMTAAFTLPMGLVAKQSIDAASDLEESLNKVNVVFAQNGKVIEKWSQNSAKAMGMSQQQALEAAGTFGNLFKAMNMGEADTTRMSTKLVELASDLASFNNIDPSEALLKLRAGLVGEAEPLRTLGVQLSEEVVKQKAVQMGLKATADELTAQDKVLARYQIILDQTKTAQGDFTRTSDGLANSQRILTAEFTNVKAKLGQELLPIAINISRTLIDVLEGFNGLSEGAKKAVIAIGGFLFLSGPIMTFVGTLGQMAGAGRVVMTAMIGATKWIGAFIQLSKEFGVVQTFNTVLLGTGAAGSTSAGGLSAMTAAANSLFASLMRFTAAIAILYELYTIIKNISAYMNGAQMPDQGGMTWKNGQPATGAGFYPPGFASGGVFKVPSGYPNDTFPIRVSSGETVSVSPAGSRGGSISVPITINTPMMLASQYEAENVLAPFIEAALRRRGRYG